MNYLCPKCGNFMITSSTASIPAYSYYQCLHCGYKSKEIREHPLYETLPKVLWSDEDSENEI